MSTLLENSALILCLIVGTTFSALPAHAQSQNSPAVQQPGVPASGGSIDAPEGKNPPEPQQKRIFGIIPNYRTFPSMLHYKPLTSGEKMKIAAQDSFDRGTFALAAAFGGEGQLSGSNPSLGHGFAGFGRYFATAYGDFAIGDFMTEGIFPSLFHQDPRYFRRGTGATGSRMLYSVGQLFRTRGDSGRMEFNISEIGGNAAAVAISNAYYPENRDFNDAIVKLGTQIGVDMTSNLLKEFAPDWYRHFSRKHDQSANR